MVFNETVGVSTPSSAQPNPSAPPPSSPTSRCPRGSAGARLADGGRRAQRGHREARSVDRALFASRFDERRAVPVEVSANAQDYPTDGVTFAYTPPLA